MCFFICRTRTETKDSRFDQTAPNTLDFHSGLQLFIGVRKRKKKPSTFLVGRHPPKKIVLPHNLIPALIIKAFFGSQLSLHHVVEKKKKKLQGYQRRTLQLLAGAMTALYYSHSGIMHKASISLLMRPPSLHEKFKTLQIPFIFFIFYFFVETNNCLKCVIKCLQNITHPVRESAFLSNRGENV